MSIPKPNKAVLALVASAVLVGGASVGGSAANAEPVAQNYAIVGSGTLEDVTNALANGTDGNSFRVISRATTGGLRVSSYDAIGSPTIQTKAHGPIIDRPAGSSAGINALLADIAADPITPNIDIVRSSRPLNATELATLTSYNFARDAVSYAYVAVDGAAASAVDDLSGSALLSVYTAGGSFYRIPGTTVDVVGVLPGVGSGTRATFLNTLSNPTVGAAVVNGTFRGQQIEANSGLVLEAIYAARASGAEAVIVPFSVGSWIGQKNGVAPDRTGAVTRLGTALPGTSPTTGTAPKLAPNTTYYLNTTWGRTTVLAAETARVAADPALASLLDWRSVNSLVGTSAASVKTTFGFLP